MIQPGMDKKISVVIVGVRDMDRAVDFYRSVLGLRLKFRTPEYSEFRTASIILALEKRREKILPTGPSFTFPTKSIHRDREKLLRAGVKFWRDLQEQPFGKVLMARDTEGNVFEIVQYEK